MSHDPLPPPPLLLLAPLWFIAGIAAAGVFTPGYSHLHQAISELAAPGAPWALMVRFGGFVPLGAAFLWFALGLRKLPAREPFRPAAILLFGLTGLALITASLFPTDEFGRRIGVKANDANYLLLFSIFSAIQRSSSSPYLVPTSRWPPCAALEYHTNPFDGPAPRVPAPFPGD